MLAIPRQTLTFVSIWQVLLRLGLLGALRPSFALAWEAWQVRRCAPARAVAVARAHARPRHHYTAPGTHAARREK